MELTIIDINVKLEVTLSKSFDYLEGTKLKFQHLRPIQELRMFQRYFPATVGRL